MRFAIFPLHLSKVLCLPRQSDARSYEGLHLSRKIIFPKPKICCSKMQPLSGNQRADLLTSLMHMSLVLRLPREMHLPRSSWNVPRLPSFLEMLQNLHLLLTFDKVHNPHRLPRKTTSERPKVLRTLQFFALLTSKCASRHNGVHFFDTTSKSALNPSVCTFDFEMCFAPQRRALFRHLNFQKCSEPSVFLHFWLRNVLRASTTYTFSTSQLPKMVRTWGVLYIWTWKFASRHNGVHFFDISTSKSGPNVRCFVHLDLEMCFAPQRRALFRHLNFQKWSEREVSCTFGLGNVLRATTGCTFSTSQLPKVVRTWGVLYIFDFEMCFAPARRTLFRHLNFQKWSEHEVFCTFGLGNLLRATTACTFSTSQLPKVVRTWGVLYIWTWKCASRHNGVHYFDISTSKSGPNVRCLVHLDLEMCFAPQQRALFQHPNFQKWSERAGFLAFSFANVRCATTACNSSSLIWPDGSAHAALASLLLTLRTQISGKTLWIATFLPFRAPASSFFSLFLFSDLLSSALLLSDSSHLCFPICPHCRKFDF